MRGLLLAFLLFVTTVASAYTFSLLNIGMHDFLTINYIPLMKAIFSIEGLVFFLLSSMPIAIILLIGERFDYYRALTFSESGYLLGALISVFAFGLYEWMLPLVFVAVGIIWAIKWLKLKESELNSKLKFSAGQGAAEKIIIVSLIGFFIFLTLTAVTESKQIEANFVPDLLAVSLGDTDSFKDSITDMVVGISVESQRKTVDSITDLASYKKLSEKNDTDVLTFLLQVEALKTEMNKTSYTQTIKEVTAQQTGDIDITSKIIEQLPVAGVSKLAWLLYIIVAFVTLHMVGSLIVKNLSALYFTGLKVFFEKAFPKEAIVNQQPTTVTTAPKENN